MRVREGEPLALVVRVEDPDRDDLGLRRQAVDDPGARGAVADDVARLLVVDDGGLLEREIDPQAPDQLAADRRVAAVDARIDDRDRDALAPSVEPVAWLDAGDDLLEPRSRSPRRSVWNGSLQAGISLLVIVVCGAAVPSLPGWSRRRAGR